MRGEKSPVESASLLQPPTLSFFLSQTVMSLDYITLIHFLFNFVFSSFLSLSQHVVFVIVHLVCIVVAYCIMFTFGTVHAHLLWFVCVYASDLYVL